ncbi:hypothetical protein ACQKCJ_07390 [Flavobacterium sp. NPDC079362]|uniref:hypothetical protein n=1 Tax=Flavobacterium sp. NPDC079362 TaxID=3390566 RepID=UPI003D00968E
MDLLVAIFSIILILIVLVTNIIFIRKINRTKSSNYKYKIFFFLISIASISAIMIIGAIFQNTVLIDYFKITMDIKSYQYRIIVMTVILIINIIANFTLLKLYLKRIGKSKNKINEIELIGIE